MSGKHRNEYNHENNYQKVCDRCGGNGKILVMGEEACSKCAGTGRNMRSALMSMPCLACNGKGRVPYCRYEICKYCRGSRKLAY